jgi:hypothetical protein
MKNFKITSFKHSLLVLIVLIIGCQTTRTVRYGKGENFPILAFPQGIGTLLFFHIENDPSNEKIRFDVAIISEQYSSKLRTVFVDVNKKPHLVTRHRIQETPTLILFDRLGTEFYRWMPSDFQSYFGRKEIERKIDQLYRQKKKSLEIGEINIKSAELEVLPLLVSDDFEQENFDNWLIHPSENWILKKDNDSKVLALQEPGKQGKVRAPTAYALLKDFNVTDFIFKGDIKSYQDPDILVRDMVVIFHYQDSTHFYYVHFSAKSDDKHNIIAIVNGEDREKINHESEGASQARLTDNEFHKFKVSYDSKTSKICSYLDDMTKPILTANDSTFSHGLVGVGSFDDTGCVDDVKLWGRRLKGK